MRPPPIAKQRLALWIKKYSDEIYNLERMFGIETPDDNKDRNLKIKSGLEINRIIHSPVKTGLTVFEDHLLTADEQGEMVELQNNIRDFHHQAVRPFLYAIQEVRKTLKAIREKKLQPHESAEYQQKLAELKKHHTRIQRLFANSFIKNNDFLKQLATVKKANPSLNDISLPGDGGRNQCIVMHDPKKHIPEKKSIHGDSNEIPMPVKSGTIYLHKENAKEKTQGPSTLIAYWQEKKPDDSAFEPRPHTINAANSAAICNLLQPGECLIVKNENKKTLGEIKQYRISDEGDLLFLNRANDNSGNTKKIQANNASKFETIAALCGYNQAMWVQGYSRFCERMQQHQDKMLTSINELIAYANEYFPVELEPLVMQKITEAEKTSIEPSINYVDQHFIENKEKEKKYEEQYTPTTTQQAGNQNNNEQEITLLSNTQSPSPTITTNQPLTAASTQPQSAATSKATLKPFYAPPAFQPYFPGSSQQKLSGFQTCPSLDQRLNFFIHTHPAKPVAIFYNDPDIKQNRQSRRQQEDATTLNRRVLSTNTSSLLDTKLPDLHRKRNSVTYLHTPAQPYQGHIDIISTTLPNYHADSGLFWRHEEYQNEVIAVAYSTAEARILFYGILYHCFQAATREGNRILDLSALSSKAPENAMIQEWIRDIAALPEFCGQFDTVYFAGASQSTVENSTLTTLKPPQAFKIRQLVHQAQNDAFSNSIRQRSFQFHHFQQQKHSGQAIDINALRQASLLPQQHAAILNSTLKSLSQKANIAVSERKKITNEAPISKNLDEKMVQRAQALISSTKKHTAEQWILSIEIAQLSHNYLDSTASKNTLQHAMERYKNLNALVTAEILDKISNNGQKQETKQQNHLVESKDPLYTKIQEKIEQLEKTLNEEKTTSDHRKKILTDIVTYSRQLVKESFSPDQNYPINPHKLTIISRCLTSLLAHQDLSNKDLRAFHKFFIDSNHVTTGKEWLSTVQRLIHTLENFSVIKEIFPEYCDQESKLKAAESKAQPISRPFFSRFVNSPRPSQHEQKQCQLTQQKNKILSSLEKNKAVFDLELNLKHITSTLRQKIKTLREITLAGSSTIQYYNHIFNFLADKQITTRDINAPTPENKTPITPLKKLYEIKHQLNNNAFPPEYYLRLSFLIAQLETHILALAEQNFSDSAKPINNFKLALVDKVLEYFHAHFSFTTHNYQKNCPLDRINEALGYILAATSCDEIPQIVDTYMDPVCATYLKANVNYSKYSDEALELKDSSVHEFKSLSKDSLVNSLSAARNNPDSCQEIFYTIKTRLDLCCELIPENFTNLIQIIPDTHVGRTFSLQLWQNLANDQFAARQLLQNLDQGSEQKDEKDNQNKPLNKFLTLITAGSEELGQLESLIEVIAGDTKLSQRHADFLLSSRNIVRQFETSSIQGGLAFLQVGLTNNPQYVKLYAEFLINKFLSTRTQREATNWLATLIYTKNPNINLLPTYLQQNKALGMKGATGYCLWQRAAIQAQVMQQNQQKINQAPSFLRGIYSRLFNPLPTMVSSSTVTQPTTTNFTNSYTHKK